MTYDGNSAATKGSTVKIPDPRTIGFYTASPGSFFSIPVGYYSDSNNFYMINFNQIYVAPKSDPSDTVNQGNFQVSGQPNFINNITKTPIGNYYYAFATADDLGGAHGGIFKAHKDFPLYWQNTGDTMPDTGTNAAAVYFDSSNIYVIGGASGSNGTTTIQVAPVSTPTTFSISGDVLPAALGFSTLVQIGSTLYLYGGKDATGTDVNTIFSASTSAPTVWTSVGTIPVTASSIPIYVDGSNIYLYIGNGSTTDIYSTSVSTPTSGFTNVGSIAGDSVVGAPIYSDSNFIYLYANSVSRAPVSTPTVFTTFLGTLATAASGASVGVHNGRIWAFGGRSSSGVAQTTIQATDTTSSAYWKNSSSVLPTALQGGAIIKTSTKFYIIGGNGITGGVYSAPLSAPDTWTLDGINGPVKAFGKAFVSGNHVYYFGGENNSGTPSTNAHRAVIENGSIVDDSWVQGNNLYVQLTAPASISRFVLFVAGNYVYITGGFVSGPAINTNVYRAPINNLFTTGGGGWINVGTIGTGLVDSTVAVINNKVYIIGGGSSVASPPVNSARTVTYASLADLASGFANFSTETNFINSAIAGATCVCLRDRMVLVGGRSTTNGVTNISKSSGFSYYRPILPYIIPGADSIPIIDPKSGAVGSLTQHQHIGMAPWLVTDK